MNEDRSDATENDPVISVYGFRMRRSTYKLVQLLCIGACLVLAILCYALLRDSQYPALRYAWVVFAVGVVAEGIETLVFHKNVAPPDPPPRQTPMAVPLARQVDLRKTAAPTGEGELGKEQEQKP